MKTAKDDLLGLCVARLRELPFVEQADVVKVDGGKVPHRDGRLRIVTPGATQVMDIEARRTHLTRTLIDGVLAQAALRAPRPWILMAPHVGRPLARYLDEQAANFVDLAGNCRLQIGRRHIAKVEGRPARRRQQAGRGIGAPGMQLMFALLVRPDLLNGPVRAIATAAGVATATAADQIARLRAQGLVHGTGHGKKLTEPRRLMELWLRGYETLVRPKLLIGRYRTQDDDPENLERLIEKTLGNRTGWAYGGGAAGHRLTGYYRGADTVVHLDGDIPEVTKHLRALPADDGPLTLIRAPGPIAFEGAQPRTVAPLLVYAELLVAGDRRAREAATEIQRKYLAHIP